MIVINSKAKSNDLCDLAELVKSSTIKLGIDKTFKLADAADAFSYFGSKKACGKVVITI